MSVSVKGAAGHSQQHRYASKEGGGKRKRGRRRRKGEEAVSKALQDILCKVKGKERGRERSER